jgi:transglutaminase-like putative cysteine protease
MATSEVSATATSGHSIRRLGVRHTTAYVYDQQIPRSVHRLHLRPIHDRLQNVISHRLQIETDTGYDATVHGIEFNDVFGNATMLLDIQEPYRQLTIRAESIVDLLDVDPFCFPAVRARPKFPISWMPSERMMLAPYLTPVELPETQLEEISTFARQFVERNQNDLFETLFAVNLTLFREFQYAPLSTTLATTPFDVLTGKRGVCQDFANLMICMMRMLDIPARYVCGYVFTGNTGNARAQSDATHAWVELYLPHIGWKAFDPTNGVLPSTDHIRLAVGRHYREAAPVSGTLYSPANEQMTVDVEVADVPFDATAADVGPPAAEAPPPTAVAGAVSASASA